ncbi:hypothetical protein [Pseudaminobacter soli (ex Li et al. 2025)]|uniref:Uncharacterized protein n=1 Tax=Pseudaminobacter soli (ex Li et al. 2025) TaxID=1295366 RepID=A0A2P7SGT6_9HYPH|nr:hypothetical protein [Mesorhizobium soli]PSJ61605.1 hypothetical protein C7I85_11255 [Mesorhizobium soli]
MSQPENRDDRKRSLLAYARDEQGRDVALRSGPLLAMAKPGDNARGDPTPPRQSDVDPRQDSFENIAASSMPQPSVPAPASVRVSVFGRIAGRISSLLRRPRKKSLAGTASEPDLSDRSLPGAAEKPVAMASGTALNKVAEQFRRAPEFNERDKQRLLSDVRSLFGRDGVNVDGPGRRRAFAESKSPERGDNTFVVVINEGQRDAADDRRGRRARKRRKPLFGDWRPDAEWNRGPAVTEGSDQPRAASHVECWQVSPEDPSVSANPPRASAPTAPAPAVSRSPAEPPHDPEEISAASSIDEIRANLQDFREAVEELTRSRTRRRYF